MEGALPCWKVAWHVGGECQGLGRQRRADLPGDGRRASLETGRATAGAARRLRGSRQMQDEVLNCPRAHSSDITPRKKTVLGWLCSQRDVQACGGAGKNYAGLLGVKSWDERGKWTV